MCVCALRNLCSPLLLRMLLAKEQSRAEQIWPRLALFHRSGLCRLIPILVLVDLSCRSAAERLRRNRHPNRDSDCTSIEQDMKMLHSAWQWATEPGPDPRVEGKFVVFQGWLPALCRWLESGKQRDLSRAAEVDCDDNCSRLID